MNHLRLGRRSVLLYAGLGIAGVGSALALKGLGRNSGASNGAIAPTDALLQSAQATSSQSLPEFQGISQWLNSAPLRVANLNGKVVLVQFWTFECINCQRTLPYIVQWHKKYAAQGLQVIGVHTPEFAFERDVNNVRDALKQHDITYPVPLDNNFQTWKAYNNRYWPNLYLADRQGFLRYSHSGEGAYDTTEQTIRRLLG
ncbi:MAG: thioredoxin family protein, partial [Thermosynechococcaceae cyanobacterium]